MRKFPEYRLRLFMSVDLVGSTSYKNKAGSRVDGVGADPRWVKQIKHFYQDFPAQIKINYKSKSSSIAEGLYAECCPYVWKTIGDEIILCCRIIDMQHAFLCVDVFLATLKNYGYWLDSQAFELDVKGSAWVASFPNPNITVLVNKDGVVENERFSGSSDEDIELQADREPSKFDFLGKSIDTGFRISKYAQQDKLVLSLELAYIISHFSHIKSEMLKFYLTGKYDIKGVLGDRPYPIIAIDAERSHERRRLRTKEENLRPKINSDPVDFAEYIEMFMRDAKLDIPALAVDSLSADDIAPPSSFLEYKERWEREEYGSSVTDNQRDEGESEEAAKGAGDLRVPQESFLEMLDRIFKAPPDAKGGSPEVEKAKHVTPSEVPPDPAPRLKGARAVRSSTSRSRRRPSKKQ